MIKIIFLIILFDIYMWWISVVVINKNDIGL